MAEEPSNPIPFYKKGGLGQTVLRIKQGETLELAVERLRKEGWDIPDLTKLEVKEDESGKYFIVKG
jgi:hypothetical protein